MISDELTRELLQGNSVRAVAIATGGVALALTLIWMVRALARRKLRNAHLTTSEVDDFVLDATGRTKLWLLLLPIVYLAFRSLRLPPELKKILSEGAAISFIAQIAHWASGLVAFWLNRWQRRRRDTDPASATTLNVFRIAAVSAIWVVGVLAAIDNLGFNVGTLIAGLGIGGVAVALATQNILGDLFASLSIVIDKPFAVGDFITVGTEMGTVEQIGLKSTQIRSISGEQLVIGNADLLKSRIRNFKRMAERRIVFRLGVIYQTSPELLEQIPVIIRRAVEARPDTRFDRSHFVNFGDSSYDFETVYWVTSPEYLTYADTHQAICLDLVRQFAAEGIEFAYPTRTLFVNPDPSS